MVIDLRYLPAFLAEMTERHENDLRLTVVEDLESENAIFVQDGNHGEYRPLKHEFIEDGVPFIRPSNLNNGRVDLTNCDRINEVAFERVRKGIGRGGDIILTSNATVGRVAITSLDAPTFVANPQTTVWRSTNSDILDQRYLYYFMCSRGFQEQLQAHTGQNATFDYVSLSKQRSLVLPLPSIHNQRAIAHILGTLDDKIELNRGMNETLEATARAIFKSWFIDFDPVRAKMDGRKPTGMDEKTAALFPDEFEESELGKIPKGWEVKKIGDCLIRHSVGKKYNQKTVLPSGNIPVLDQGKSGIIGFHNDEPGAIASFEEPKVVFANHTCYMRLITHPFSAIQNVLPFTGKGVDTVWMYYATLDIQPFIEYKGHWPDFIINEIVLPPKELTTVFREWADPLVRMSRQIEHETSTLAQLRDTLLPKLLSGELRVADAEKIVEGVT